MSVIDPEGAENAKPSAETGMNPASSITRGVEVGQRGPLNSGGRSAVQPRTNGTWLLTIVMALGALASCTDVSGGAVELSWLLRPSNGDESACSEQTCCETSRVAQMRLMWDVGGATGSDAWRCTDNRAVTGF